MDTDYVIYGDGRTFKVMNPSDRDTALKKLAKSNKNFLKNDDGGKEID